MILALVVALAAQFALPSGTELPEDSGLAPRRLRDPAPLPTPDYPAILRAPIFTPDRSPGESATEAGASPAATAARPVVLGVATGPHGGSAVVRPAAGGDPVVLQPGQAVQGWRLLAVTAEGAVFLGPAGRVTLPVGQSAPSSQSPQASQTTASEPPP